MDLETELLLEHSKRNTVRVSEWIGSDRRRFASLMELFLRGEDPLPQRAAWVLSVCAEHHPALLRPWLRTMVRKMQESGVHGAVKRNGSRVLQTVDIPGDLLGEVISVCYQYLGSPSEEIAVRANAMSVLAKIAAEKTGLRRELRAVLEQMEPLVEGGLKARCRIALLALSDRRSRKKIGGRRGTG